jgi:lysozyme
VEAEMDIREQLSRDEGVRSFPYLDTVGKTTIGVGRNLTDVGVSSDEIDLMLTNDISRAEATLAASLPWSSALGDARRGVLVNMAFNMENKILGFHNMLAAMEAGNWEAAATAMLDSQWAKQVGDRAVRLAEQMRTGEWV